MIAPALAYVLLMYTALAAALPAPHFILPFGKKLLIALLQLIVIIKKTPVAGRFDFKNKKDAKRRLFSILAYLRPSVDGKSILFHVNI